jgi:putative transposase
MTETATVGRRGRGEKEPSPDQRLAEELVERARSEGLELLGEGGLLQQMTKAVLERGLAEELTDHLGYEPYDPAGNGSGNSRNGTSPKRVLTEGGSIELDVPRDRAGTFEPQLVRKGQRRLGGIDKIVMEPVYPVVFLDAIICKVRDNGTVINKAAHLAVGVDVDGKKEVLGIWVETTEGAKFWLRVMNELKARGVQDVLIVVCDGLKGLPAAIEAVWPKATVQTSSVDTGGGGMVSPVTAPPGEDLCRRVAFEALMQTCPSRRRRAA